MAIRSLPYAEDTPLRGPPSLRRQQVLRGPDRADLRARPTAAGRDHPLREFLRRRRSELEPHRARHHPLGAARRAPGDPLRRPVRPRLFLRGRRRRRLHAAGRAALAANRSCAAQAFNFSNEIQITVLDLVERILQADGFEAGARHSQRSHPTKFGTSTSAPQGRARCWAGARCSPWTKGLERTIAGTGSFLPMT